MAVVVLASQPVFVSLINIDQEVKPVGERLLIYFVLLVSHPQFDFIRVQYGRLTATLNGSRPHDTRLNQAFYTLFPV